MAEVSLPEIRLADASFGIRRSDNVLSLMNGKDVITEFTHAVWIAQLQIVPLTEEEAGAWTGPLARLSRISNYFKSSPPSYKGAAYKATTLQVDGAGQLGMQLNVKNAESGAFILRAGEYFEVNGETKIVVQDCIADGSGKGTVEFEPPLRTAPTDSATLNTQTPTIKWRLAEPEIVWNIRLARFHHIALDIVEVV